MTASVNAPISKNWDLRRRLAVFLIIPAIFLASTITAIPLVLAFGTEVSVPIALAITFIAEIGVIFWALWFGGLLKEWKTTLGFNKFKFKHILYGILIGQAAYWGLQLFAIALSALGLTFESSDTSVSLFSLEGFFGILIIFIAVPFIGPFIEEVLFRGVIIGSLKETKWNKNWLMILFSAVIFGLLHVQGFSTFTDFALLGWITLMGAVFAWFFIKTESIWAVFAAHSVYNLTSSVLSFAGVGG